MRTVLVASKAYPGRYFPYFIRHFFSPLILKWSVPGHLSNQRLEQLQEEFLGFWVPTSLFPTASTQPDFETRRLVRAV